MSSYFAIQWHITDNCDLRCKHCYIYAKKMVKPVETPWDNLLSTLDGLAPTHDKLRRLGSFKATVNAILPQKSDPYGIYDGCHCAKDHLTITADGNIMACRRFDSVVGNVETGIYDAFKSSEMDKYRHYGKFEKCKDCVLLRFCRGCPAVAYGYKRDFYASDPQCWRTVKSSV